MFRNQYDTDVTVWSPEGRLLQVEYAMESVKQGSACIGLRSDTICVLGALKRNVSELSQHKSKLMIIDDHIICGIAGLTADARSLIKYMQEECLHHKYVYGVNGGGNGNGNIQQQAMCPHVLMSDIASKHQRTTQSYVRRPYGVGLLIACYDPVMETPHLYQTCPSGNIYEFMASAIGSRSQSARTYLEKHYESFTTSNNTKDELIMHALQALVGCVSGDDELTTENGSIAVVDATNKTYEIIEGEALKPYLDKLEITTATKNDDDDDDDAPAGEGGGGGGGGDEAKEGGEGSDDAMET